MRSTTPASESPIAAGAVALAPRQLYVFDDPGRDDRGWVISVVHLDVVHAELLAASDRTRVVAVDELPPLPPGHRTIVAFGVGALRADYGAPPRLAP